MLDSPYRLTALAIASDLLGLAGLVACSFPPVYKSLPLLIIGGSFVVIGFGGMYWLTHSLREHVQNERWPPEEIAPFRQVTGHVLWKWAMFLLFVWMLFSLFLDRHHRAYYLVVFFFLQLQTEIGNAFALPRKLRNIGHSLDLGTTSALHSEHWTER